jgi:hypothetical protein
MSAAPVTDTEVCACRTGVVQRVTDWLPCLFFIMASIQINIILPE